ncbi:glycosyltransferase family 87 protein [Gordonia sp. ABSL1-1]|uniref:glycosyltransferase family 87 protein n=1 Tax=Gordonia sp. ABSL1-1 TaxID=3053923 RepID=UPI0025733BEA|nr:glycosyltransferase family 87 protein [Gordonia sp. ABSL1-1]MDL9936408.1 glycosyltransferase family 87 protein [Gordonia sp. ABSL1-1]
MATVDKYLYPQVSVQRIIPMILWPLSIMMVFQRSVILGVNGSRTDDFRPVYDAAFAFLNRLPVYGENLDTVSPHYLYPPSGTLLMSPVAVIDFERARWLFIAVSVIALVVSAYLLTRMFGYSVTSWVMPAVLFFFFSTETVANTLIFTNFNAFVLLGMLAFMLLLIKRYDLWAGAAIGLTIAVKPVLAPLLLLALLNRQWKVLITGIGIPAALMVVAWPLSVDAKKFLTDTTPYLSEARDYYNSSIPGNGAYFGVAPWLVILLRVAFVAMAVFSLWFLYRYYRTTNELLWLSASSGVLLGTTFLVGALGQGYYSMLLFPLLMTVVLPGSPVRNWPAWLGVYGCMAFDSFYSERWNVFGWILEYGKVTWGWSLLMIAVFCSLLFRYLDIRAAEAAEAPAPEPLSDSPGDDAPTTAAVAAS